MDDGSVIQVIQKQRQRTPIKNLAMRSQIFFMQYQATTASAA